MLFILDLGLPAEFFLSGERGGDVRLSNDDFVSLNLLLPGPERSLLPVRDLLAASISFLTSSAILAMLQNCHCRDYALILVAIYQISVSAMK